MQDNNPIDDAGFDEILKAHNVTPQVGGNDPWADMGLPEMNKQSPIDTLFFNQPTQNVPAENDGSVGSFVKNMGKAAYHNVVDPVTNRMNEVADNAYNNNQSKASNVLQSAGALAGGVVDVPLEGLSKIGSAMTPNSANGAGSDILHKIGEHISPVIKDKVSQAYQSIQQIMAEHPEAAANIGAAFNIASILPGEGAIKSAGAKIADTFTAVKEAAKEAASAVKSKVGNIGLGKTEEEILATTPDKVYKLSPTERDIYFKNQKDTLARDIATKGNMSEKEIAARQAEVDANHQAIVAKANTELAANTTKAEQDIADFSKELDQVAYNKTIELKPKAIKTLGEQSKTYSKLIEEDLAPFKDTYIDDRAMIKAIQDKFPSNPYSPDPYKADRLIKEMGLKEGSTRKVGEVYDSLKDIKSMMSKSGKVGNKVFTPSDMDLTDKISALSDALSANGVDLSRANDFWKQWAPLRDKIVTKLKPFDTLGLETKTFSNILKTSGKDIDNQNFIKAFEDVLGEGITGETRAAMEKLSTAEKLKLAAKIDAENAITDTKIAKDTATNALKSESQATKEALSATKESGVKGIESQKIETERLAKRRDNIRKLILGAMGSGVGVGAYNTLVGH